jgi:hypothetical protein
MSPSDGIGQIFAFSSLVSAVFETACARLIGTAVRPTRPARRPSSCRCASVSRLLIARITPTQSSETLRMRWMPRRASAVGLASQRAPTALHRSSPAPRSRTSAYSYRDNLSAIARARHGRAGGQGDLRGVHLVRRVPGRVSEDISIDTIARMYRDYRKATMIARAEKASA